MKAFGIFFALVFLFFGIAGFISALMKNQQLFAIFQVNLFLNILYILLGICAIIVSFLTSKAVRFYFQIIGVILAFLALFGFIYGEKEILGTFASNRANTWLHVTMAVATLILGYGARD